MKKMIIVVLVMLFSGCATGKYATQPNSRPTWLEGRRVAVCADRSYSGVVTATENALRQMYGAVIVFSSCRSEKFVDEGVEYVATVEVLESFSYSGSKIWIKIISDGGRVSAIGYGESKSFYVSGFAAGRKNYAEAAVTSSRNQHDQLRSAAEDAVRNLH